MFKIDDTGIPRIRETIWGSRLLFFTLTCFVPLLIFIIFSLLSLRSYKALVRFFSVTSFFIMAILFICWIYQLFELLKYKDFSFPLFVRKNIWALASGLILAGIIFISVPVGFKVLNDEINLLSVSQSMHLNFESLRIIMAKYYDSSLHIIKTGIPNRPLFFPFLETILHTLTGYRPANAFILNFIVLFCFLTGTYITVQKLANHMTALSALFLVASMPVLAINATCGGYDLLFLLFFFLSFLMLYNYFFSPNPEKFAFLWLSLVVLANIRYEAIAYSGIMMLLMIIYSKGFKVSPYYHVVAATPLFMLPYIWQRILSVGTYENPPGVPLFSIDSFIKNLKIMLAALANPDFFLPYNGILNLAGIGMLIYLVFAIASKKIKLTAEGRWFLVTVFICCSTMMLIVLAHFLGRYDLPTQARLFLPVSAGLALVPIVFFILIPRAIPVSFLLFSSILLFFIYHPIAVRHTFPDAIIAARIHKNIVNFLESQNDKNFLVIYPYSPQITSFGFGAITTEFAERNADVLRQDLERGLYTRIYAIDVCDDQVKSPIYTTGLSSRFNLTPIQNIHVMRGRIIRISHVSIK